MTTMPGIVWPDMSTGSGICNMFSLPTHAAQAVVSERPASCSQQGPRHPASAHQMPCRRQGFLYLASADRMPCRQGRSRPVKAAGGPGRAAVLHAGPGLGGFQAVQPLCKIAGGHPEPGQVARLASGASCQLQHLDPQAVKGCSVRQGLQGSDAHPCLGPEAHEHLLAAQLCACVPGDVSPPRCLASEWLTLPASL